MLVYQDTLTGSYRVMLTSRTLSFYWMFEAFSCDAGDELLSDSFDVQEIHNGIFYEVEGRVRR